MPKKAEEFRNNINIRISNEQKEKWNSYLKAHSEFSSISHFIRWCVDEIIDGTYLHRQGNNEKELLKKKIEQYDQQLNQIEKDQKELFKQFVIAKSSNQIEPEKMKLISFQKGILLNYLREKPRRLDEIEKLFDNLTEIEILTMLNDLLESSLINQDKNKYMVII